MGMDVFMSCNEPIRTCKECKIDQLLTEYWLLKKSGKLRRLTCRTCLKKRQAEYRKTESYKNSFKKSWNIYSKTEKGRATIKRSREKRISSGKYKATFAVWYAKKIGLIKKLPCEACGEKKSEAHHCDYSKKLDIVWLCRQCHVNSHKELSNEL